MTAAGWYQFIVWLWHQTLYAIAWITIYRWVRDRWRAYRGRQAESKRAVR